MKKIPCKIGIHEWKWNLPEKRIVKRRKYDTVVRNFQSRTCKICGKYEERVI